jgi:sodium transport system permease protein
MTIPLMMLNMLVGVSAMMKDAASTDFYFFLVPLYNSVQCMQGIFMFEYSITNVLLTVMTNVAFSCAGGFVLAKMLENEKIVFNK